MASDVRRIVTIDDTAGTVAVVLDLETGASYRSVRGSTKITPGARQPTLAKSQRRYGGARQTGESHTNGTFSWQILVAGTTADLAMASVEALLAVLEAPLLTYYLEWRPAGTTNSVYYELRGAAVWTPTYEWAQFNGALSMIVEISLPIAPLVRHTAFNIAIGSTTMPNTIALASAITGNAPALADISLTASGGTAPPIWALIAWTKRPGTPLASSVAPWGVIEAETGTGLTTWASAADANARGGNYLTVTTSGAGTANALYAIDPSVMTPDAFSRGEITVVVWARIAISSGVVSPKLIVSVEPFAGTSFGAPQYSAEYGAAGKAITKPASVTGYRFVRLGTLNLPVNPAAALKYNLRVAASWAIGSAGQFALDYLVLTPARQCALSPSAKANDASYPDFIASTGATTKLIRSDLSGAVASGAGALGRDAGLGGSQIELPPGNVDLLVKLSSLVADDPTSDNTSEQLAHTAVTGNVRVTPRSWLAGGP